MSLTSARTHVSSDRVPAAFTATRACTAVRAVTGVLIGAVTRGVAGLFTTTGATAAGATAAGILAATGACTIAGTAEATIACYGGS